MKFLSTILCLFMFLFAFSQNAKKKLVTNTQTQNKANPDSIFSSFAKESNRIGFYRSLVNEQIHKSLSLVPSDTASENAWIRAFWGISLLNYKSPWISNRLITASKDLDKRSIGFQKAFLQMAYSVYPGEYVDVAEKILKKTNDAGLFVMSADCLLKQHDNTETRTTILTAYENQRMKPGVALASKLLIDKIQETEQPVPPIKDLLNQKMLGNAVTVYSLQRKNRDYPGLVIIKKADGKFLRKEDGSIFAVPQLGRSLSNMSSYIINGNPPQGIYLIKGFDTSKNQFIGPSENIQLLMPFETTPSAFNPKLNKEQIDRWHTAYYKSLLPVSWQNYRQIFDTYFVSMMGRTEIIAHGSTINPDYYKNNPYYPLTPSMGCLVTKEIWDIQTGRRRESDQQQLTDAIKKVSGVNGYFIVVEIDNKNEAVSLKEVTDIIASIQK
jgi:hypothetical protein